MAHDLAISTIASAQATGQWQTSNDADAALGNSQDDIYTVDFSGGDVTLTSAQFRSAKTFMPSGMTANQALTIPSVKRALFIVDNDDATYTITVTKGSTTVAVGPGEIAVLNTDGTTNSLRGSVLDTGSGSVSPIGKQTVWIPASSMLAATTSGPATAQTESTTNKVNLFVLDFDKDADEYAHFNIAMPKSWNRGTITFRYKWRTGLTTGGVAMALQAVAISDDDPIDAAYGTAVVVTDSASATAGDLLVSAESSAVTVAGTPAEGDLVVFRLFRDVSDAADDLAGDCRLVGLTLFYTTDAATDD